MWYSTVIKLPGQSMEEACTRSEQFICVYDGDVYGDRQAKKMAKRAGVEYIRHGANIGQPRLVKTPIDPRAGTAPEGAIYSRDRQRGFYWVAPENLQDMLGFPDRAYDRDVLGDDEARRLAEEELARESSAAEHVSRLKVHGSDFLATFYRPLPGADGVYALDIEAALRGQESDGD